MPLYHVAIALQYISCGNEFNCNNITQNEQIPQPSSPDFSKDETDIKKTSVTDLRKRTKELDLLKGQTSYIFYKTFPMPVCNYDFSSSSKQLGS